MDELTLDGKTYISSKQAAKITGYAKDYVGQLCREGRIEARLVGRNWYVLETSIREHRFGLEKDLSNDKKSLGEVLEEKESPVHAWEKPIYMAEVHTEMPMLEEKPQNLSALKSITIKDKLPVTEHNVEQMQSAWQEWFKSRHGMYPGQNFEETELETPEMINQRDLGAWHELYGGEAMAKAYQTQTEEVPIVIQKIEDEGENDNRELESHEIEEENRDKQRISHYEEEDIEEVVPLHRNFTIRRPQNDETVRVSRVSNRELAHEEYSGRPPEGRIVRERRTKRSKSSTSSNFALRAFLWVIAIAALATAIINTGHFDVLLSQSNQNYAAVRFLGGESIINKSHSN